MILSASILAASSCLGQQKINTIVTTNSSSTPVTYTAIKGGGLRTASNGLASLWDSTTTNFTLKFNTGANSVTALTQFTVAGHAKPFIPAKVNALVKIRRAANAYVSDTRDHFNFWTVYSSIPANSATTGTFTLVGPEVTAPEASLLTNNINSGYDNIFQNTIANLHAGNVERVDFIVPEGVKPSRAYDITNAGAVVLDRGTGDQFQIAAITSLDANKDPLTYGTLVSVNNGGFGGDLLPAPLDYCIFAHDPKFGIKPRPSTSQNQNLRGTFISFSDMGVAVNQRIYGYSLFASDVNPPLINWNLFPTNTNSGAQLDPVNVMGFFLDVNAILPLPTEFNATRKDKQVLIDFTYHESTEETIVIERSSNARAFTEIDRIPITAQGTYRYTDVHPLPGLSYYRLHSIERYGSDSYSEVRMIRMDEKGGILVNPNPAKDLVEVMFPLSWQEKNVSLRIFNAIGARVMEKRFTASNIYSLSVSGLQSGAHLFVFTNEETGATETKTIMINN